VSPPVLTLLTWLHSDAGAPKCQPDARSPHSYLKTSVDLLRHQVWCQRFALLSGGGIPCGDAGVALRGRRPCGTPRSNSAREAAEFSTPRRATTGIPTTIKPGAGRPGGAWSSACGMIWQPPLVQRRVLPTGDGGLILTRMEGRLYTYVANVTQLFDLACPHCLAASIVLYYLPTT